MTKISSAWTPFYKRAFPALWFGILGFAVATMLGSGALREQPAILLAPILMAAFGFFVFRKLVWNLADEVFDCGEYLVVRKGSREERIHLSNVMNVSATAMMNPPQITLRLVTPGGFGDEISFSPRLRFSLNPFARSKVADDLMVRAHRARGHRGV